MTDKTEVIVVGAGPAGLTVSLLLAQHGVDVVVVERRQTRSAHPRAHFVNTRTMELFTVWGMVDAVLAEAYPQEHLPFDGLAAFGAISKEEREAISPAVVGSCAQDRIEEVLLARVEAEPRVSLRWASTVGRHESSDDGVRVVIDGPDGPSELEGRFLVAADGAHSAIREGLGIGMVGNHDLGSLINMYFHGRLFDEDEVPPLVMGAPNPEVPGGFISMNGADRWCFHHTYDPTKERVEDFPVERCVELIRRAANLADDAPIEVRSVRPWTMTAHVAERFRDGRVFLIGDAAHAFPPTGGFGMNSGIQDAHNLAWKLAAVLNGHGGARLLDSYEAERQPVAYLNTRQSLRNAHREADAAEIAELERRATRSVRSASAEASDEEEVQRLELLEHAAAIGQDLGFAYDSSPVIVDDGSIRPDILVHKYVPNACPGARAPHVVVATEGRTHSILELFEGRLSLLTTGWSSAWANAVAESTDPVELLAVGPGTPHDVDVDEVRSLYGIEAGGAVLVRPDGHVACRFAALPTDPAASLAGAIDTAMGRAVVPVA